MQSLASLMSIKQSDVGNLDDFNDSEDEVGEERRASFGTGQATNFTGNNGHTFENCCGQINPLSRPVFSKSFLLFFGEPGLLV